MRWALQIAEALAYLHHFSPLVVHRDLKLENILLTSPKPAIADAKLADFGLHKCIKVHRCLLGSEVLAVCSSRGRYHDADCL